MAKKPPPLEPAASWRKPIEIDEESPMPEPNTTTCLCLSNGITIDMKNTAPAVLVTHHGQHVPIACATDDELRAIAKGIESAMIEAAKEYRAQSQIPPAH